VSAALAVDALPGSRWRGRRAYGLPACCRRRCWPAGVGYLVAILLPTADAVDYLQAAREYYLPYREQMAAGAKKQSPQGDGDFARARVFLTQNILPPLERAAQADPSDAARVRRAGPLVRASAGSSRAMKKTAIVARRANRVIQLDPEGKDGYVAASPQLNMLRPSSRCPCERLLSASGGRPGPGREARTRRGPRCGYRLAEVYFQAAMPRRPPPGREALDLDALSTEPSRQLNDAQRNRPGSGIEPGGEK